MESDGYNKQSDGRSGSRRCATENLMSLGLGTRTPIPPSHVEAAPPGGKLYWQVWHGNEETRVGMASEDVTKSRIRLVQEQEFGVIRKRSLPDPW